MQFIVKHCFTRFASIVVPVENCENPFNARPLFFKQRGQSVGRLHYIVVHDHSCFCVNPAVSISIVAAAVAEVGHAPRRECRIAPGGYVIRFRFGGGQRTPHF